MKKFMSIAIGIVAATILSSCSVTLPHNITAAPLGDKVGESKRSIILGFITTNKNWGIAEAAKNGGIRGGIAAVDIKYKGYVVFRTETFIVYGSNPDMK